LSLVNANQENRTSNYYLVNGSYLKLRNIQLGYTVNTGQGNRGGIKDLRFYVVGDNLFWIKDTKGINEYTGPDPERAAGSRATYPRPTSFTFGVNAGF
jgi:hypothetical protein